jgi:hypothetical protein
MLVQKSRLVLDDDEARIVATVRSEAGKFAPFDLVIGVPRAYVGWLDLSGNPFVPTLLLLASCLGERFRLEGTISPRLLNNAKKACKLFQSWWGFANVSVEAEAAASERRAGEGSAFFFTRGVDSWHSALRDRTTEQPGRLTHLLYVPDFDTQYSPGTRRHAVAATREAARYLGLPLLCISHNGRELLDKFINWELSHGGVLGGIGLALGGWIAHVSLASSMHSDYVVPWGSNPYLDRLWSTERTTTHLDVAETRTNKLSAIASSDYPLSRLKICWQEDVVTNCGRCEKCVRTQCALAIAGVLDRAPVFQQPLTVETIKRLPRLNVAKEPSAQETLWREVCDSFTDEPRLAELRAAAIARLPARGRSSPAPRTSERRHTIKIEAPREAAVSLMPSSAAGLLPVPVTTREEQVETDESTCHVEITWTEPAPGRMRLPLRPTAAMGPEVLDACREAAERTNPWCLIGFAAPETAHLMERLTESWGQGITCLTRDTNARGDHGIPHCEASLIQRCSETRVWWGKSDYLDPFLVLEALRHGCLPLQCVPQAHFNALTACLPPGLSHFTLAVPEDGPVPRISKRERAARIDQGLSILLRGNMERDLTVILSESRCERI